ncbi:MAG: hypothetical protein OWS74_05235, partial [Firmicutes bacterium]|nr:hypothetical protein [Bacillota bacterium]
MWGAIKAAGLAAGSSLLHVGWNAAAKNAVARLKEMAVLAISGGIVAALIAGPQLFSSAVREMSGWIVLTIVLNAAYFGLLAWT